MNTKPTIQAVLFDLGGVILNDDFRVAAKKMAPKINRTAKQLVAAFAKADTNEFNSGKLPEKIFWSRIEDSLKLKRGELYSIRTLYYDCYTPLPNMIRLLEKIMPEYPLYLLSNQTRRAYYLQKKFGYTKYFRKLFYSFKLGVSKPDKAFYTAVLKQILIKPNALIFIDDRAKNIATADTLGFNTILFKNAVQLQRALKQYTII